MAEVFMLPTRPERIWVDVERAIVDAAITRGYAETAALIAERMRPMFDLLGIGGTEAKSIDALFLERFNAELERVDAGAGAPNGGPRAA